MDGRTDGQTDKHDVYRKITFNRSCNVSKVDPSEKKNTQKKTHKKHTQKTAYSAKRMPKQKTIVTAPKVRVHHWQELLLLVTKLHQRQ